MKVLKYVSVMTLFFLVSVSSADEGPKIMVINSNGSIDKYRIAQKEFTKLLPNPVMEVDLGGQKLKLREIEDLLYDQYPDLVYCIGTKAYLLANKFISDRNIVFTSIIDWQRLPLAEKTCGVSNELSPEMQITLFCYMFPGLNKIGVLFSPKYNRHWFKKAEQAANHMGIQLIGRPLSKKRNTISELKELVKEIDALWLIADPVILADKETVADLFKLCDEQLIPILTYHPAFAEYGAMMIISVDHATTGRQAATMTQEVLSKDTVHEKVQLPAGSHIILNLKKADEYGLKYGDSALDAANWIIE
jgi:putative ABC transport system substrate-binding protein